jgi:hypothetical protein
MVLGIVEVKSVRVQVCVGGLVDARTSTVGYAANSVPMGDKCKTPSEGNPSRYNSLPRVLRRVYPLRINQEEDRVAGNGAHIGRRTSGTYG